MVGALSGVVASVIYVLIQVPIMLIFGLGQIEEAVTRSGVDMPLTGMALALAIVVCVVIILLVSSTIGGLIGVPIFEKRKGNVAVPPPPPGM
jgi:hypothetical protein